MVDVIFLSLLSLGVLLGQAGRITVVQPVTVYVFEVVMALHLVILLARSRTFVRRHSPSVVTWALLWFIYVGAGLIVTGWGSGIGATVRASLYLARLGLYASYAFMLSYVKVEKKFATFYTRLLMIGVPLICIVQYLFVPDLRFLVQWGWDPHMYRAVGLILDPPIIGAVLGIALLGGLITQDRLAVAFNFVALILLFSRSTYLAVGSVVCVYFILQRQYVRSVLWIVILVISILLAPHTIPPQLTLESAKIERISTVRSRSVEIRHGIDAWVRSPLIGIGYNRVADYKRGVSGYLDKTLDSNHSSSAFHSFWLTQLATTGVIGVILLAVAIYHLTKGRTLLTLALAIPALIGILDNVVFHPLVLTVLIIMTHAGVWSHSRKEISHKNEAVAKNKAIT